MMTPRSFKYTTHPTRSPPSTISTIPSSPPPSVPSIAAYQGHVSRATAWPSSSSASATRPASTLHKTRFSTTAAISGHSHLPKHVTSWSDVTDTTDSHNRQFFDPKADAIMAKRKTFSPVRSISPSSVVTDRDLERPPTPTSPVQIPTRNANKGDSLRSQKHHVAQRYRLPTREMHTPEPIAPSVAALLAVTDIPRHRRSQRRKTRDDVPLTMDIFIEEQQITEKELSWSLARNPLDVLLSPPEDLDDFFSVSDSNVGSQLSTRTISADSIPSLGNSFTTDVVSSVGTPSTPGSATSRRGRSRPVRKSPEPVRSPPHVANEHPLAGGLAVFDDALDLGDTEEKLNEAVVESHGPIAFKPLRAAFKSNLTASLRALRSAARSFSAINFPSIPPDDFLTRSILTTDPNVPYADERRPPVSEEMPSAEVRRYLNPTTNARIDPQPANTSGNFSASIQMQTYKVQRSRSAPPSRATSPASGSSNGNQSSRSSSQAALPPCMRQREMRENPDFIRIAVMEMAMRKRGKLDDQQPGRARWALPPRKASGKPYEVGVNGVPVRWIPVTC